MPQSCSICIHKDRPAIDAQLIDLVPLRDIAGQWDNVSRAALSRHKAHLPAALAVAKNAAEVADANTLLAKVHELAVDARRLTKRAEHAKQLSVALQGIGQLRGILELLAKLSGQLQTASSLNLNIDVKFSSASEARVRLQQIGDRYGLTVIERLDDPVLNERRITELLRKAGHDFVPRSNVLTVDMLDEIVGKYDKQENGNPSH